MKMNTIFNLRVSKLYNNAINKTKSRKEYEVWYIKMY